MTYEGKKSVSLPEGALVVLTAGEYSDYGIIALGRVLKPFNPDDVLAEYLKAYPDQRGSFSDSQYCGWLVNIKGVIEEAPYYEYRTTAVSYSQRAPEDNFLVLSPEDTKGDFE